MHHEDLYVAYQLFCKPLCNGCLRMFGSLAGNCTKLWNLPAGSTIQKKLYFRNQCCIVLLDTWSLKYNQLQGRKNWLYVYNSVNTPNGQGGGHCQELWALPRAVQLLNLVTGGHTSLKQSIANRKYVVVAEWAFISNFQWFLLSDGKKRWFFCEIRKPC